MNYKIAVLSVFVFVAIAIVSFSIGQGKPLVQGQAVSNVQMSDHDKIEKLQIEVAELQKKLRAMTQRYDTHAHPIRLEVAQLPNTIECNQTVVRWAAAGLNPGSVDRVCRQLGDDNINVLLAASKESMVTGPPGP